MTLLLLLVTGTIFGCADGSGPAPPDPALDGMEPRVAERMGEARQAVLAAPRSADAWGRLGAVFAAHDLHEDAEVCFAQAAKLDSGDFRWSYFLAIARAFNGAPADEVIELFREASSLQPAYFPLHVRSGRALAKRGRYEAAIAAFDQALGLQPRLLDAELGAGQAWLALEDAEQAVPYLERAAGLSGSDARVLLALSQAYRMLGREAEAARLALAAREGTPRPTLPDPVWEQSVESEGISASACYNRAPRRLRQGRFDEAIEDLLIVEEVHPGRAGVQAMLGSAYRGLGRTETALEHFLRAVELRDDQAWVRYELGELYEEKRELPAALAQYRAALRLDPRSARGYLAAVRVQSGLQDLRGAITTLRAGIAQLPEHPRLHFLLGLGLRDLGRLGGALAELETALSLEPAARTHYQIGLTLERLGRTQEAVFHYREAVTIDPGHEARERLRQLTPAR